MPHDYLLQPFRAPIELRIDYASELNPQQYQAVTAPPGPALVIAGAGAGKTRTLTYRVAYLIEQGIPPERLLLLTFTNKAAKEMMRRVAELLGAELSSLWGGTFHAVGNRIMRQHADMLGYRADYTILDREDAKHLLGACRAESQFDITASRFPKAEVLANIFSLAANTHKSIPDILAEQYGYFAHLADPIQDIHDRYLARKRQNNVLDFDDLLVLWLRLLQEHPDICERYQRQFQFVLVDEYQDTNQLQSDLIDLLVARHRNVMVVGDDSQSIYAWRGANFKNILQFPQRYPEAAIYKIETNYRSTPEILAVANAAIAQNQHQFHKQLAPVRKQGQKPALVVCNEANEQAAFVGQRVLELREEGIPLNQMAILYRSHFHAMELQMELTRRNIPFSITSGIRFFEQAHIKDITAYLKLSCNPRDELAFKRIVQLLAGIGAKGADKLWKLFSCGPAHESRARLSPDTSASIVERLNRCADHAPKKAQADWQVFVQTFKELASDPVRGQPSNMLLCALETGYRDYLQETYENSRSRLEDIEQLSNFAIQFSSLDDFLAQLSLLTNLDAEGGNLRQTDDERINLTTIHQAKGLEFDVVFIIMLCDGLFPSAKSLEQQSSEEEERRLFYVAITRARKELYLSYPLMRITRGYSADIMQNPSRFLREIPTNLVTKWNLRSY